jgi:hypothetical protein
MTDLIKLDMTDIWASSGDITNPGSTKINTGWIVEAVPRQTWNWFENRQDNNIAYILQKGLPEWDALTEYQATRAYVQRSGVIYKALLTGVGQDPLTATTYWVKAFVESMPSSEALKTLTPAANTIPYFTSSSAASTTAFTAFARTLLAGVDGPTMLGILSAQTANANLTALSGTTAATNTLPYYNSATTMTTTALTSYGRSLIGVADAPTARTTLGLGNTATLNIGTTTGTVTAGDDSRVVNALQTTNNLSDIPNATTARTNISAQTLNNNLTALSGIAGAANTVAYFTGVGTMSSTSLTAYGISLIAAVSASAARTVLGLGGAAVLSVGTTTGTIAAGDDSRIVNALQKGNNLSDVASVSTTRTNLGLGGAAVLNVGTTTGTVAAGNDSRIVAALQTTNNLSDVASPATSRANLGLGNSAVLNVGTATGTVAAGNDSRIVGAAQVANNLSDLASVTTARTNLGLGTAATATVTTSAVDNTTGHLLKFGDFGIGVPVAEVNIDCNTIITSGSYYCSGSSLVNTPTGSEGWLTVLGINTSYCTQYYVVLAGTMFIRNLIAGVWSAWSLGYFARNIVSTVSQSGGVPTGGIIETGTNANGTYTKYADGTLVCFRAVGTLAITSTATSSIFTSGQYPFPATFVGAWVPSYNGQVTDSTPSVYSIGMFDHAVAAGYTGWQFTCRNTGATNITQILGASTYAIGRWF